LRQEKPLISQVAPPAQKKTSKKFLEAWNPKAVAALLEQSAGRANRTRRIKGNTGVFPVSSRGQRNGRRAP
jgi:hypothetical protein